MLPLLSPSIFSHHIFPLSRLQKNSASSLQNLWHPGYEENIFICRPFLTYPTLVSNLSDVGRDPQIYKKWTMNGGSNWGLCCKFFQELSIVSDNAREAIAKNWSDWLGKSYLIQKRKRLETTYEKFAWLIQNWFNVANTILLLCAQKCQPPGSVYGDACTHMVIFHVWVLNICIPRPSFSLNSSWFHKHMQLCFWILHFKK